MEIQRRIGTTKKKSRRYNVSTTPFWEINNEMKKKKLTREAAVLRDTYQTCDEHCTFPVHPDENPFKSPGLSMDRYHKYLSWMFVLPSLQYPCHRSSGWRFWCPFRKKEANFEVWRPRKQIYTCGAPSVLVVCLATGTWWNLFLFAAFFSFITSSVWDSTWCLKKLSRLKSALSRARDVGQ